MARRRVSHLDGTIVVLVGDENVAVGEKLSSVRIVSVTLVEFFERIGILPGCRSETSGGGSKWDASFQRHEEWR